MPSVSLSVGPKGGEVSIRYHELGDVERLLRRLKATHPNHANSVGPRIAASIPNPARDATPMRPAGRNVAAYGPPSGPLSQEELATRFAQTRADS